MLRSRGLVSTVTVEASTMGSAGPVFAAAVSVEAYVEWKRRRVRNAEGKEVVAHGTAYARLGTDTTAPVGARVTSSGRVGYVIGHTVRDGRTAALPSHVEIHLT